MPEPDSINKNQTAANSRPPQSIHQGLNVRPSVLRISGLSRIFHPCQGLPATSKKMACPCQWADCPCRETCSACHGNGMRSMVPPNSTIPQHLTWRQPLYFVCILSESTILRIVQSIISCFPCWVSRTCEKCTDRLGRQSNVACTYETADSIDIHRENLRYHVRILWPLIRANSRAHSTLQSRLAGVKRFESPYPHSIARM